MNLEPDIYLGNMRMKLQEASQIFCKHAVTFSALEFISLLYVCSIWAFSLCFAGIKRISCQNTGTYVCDLQKHLGPPRLSVTWVPLSRLQCLFIFSSLGRACPLWDSCGQVAPKVPHTATPLISHDWWPGTHPGADLDGHPDTRFVVGWFDV